MVVSLACGIGSLILIWLLYPRPYDYSTALGYSYEFYDAQRVGQLPPDFRISWRGNAYMQDQLSPLKAPTIKLPSGTTIDVSGGFMTGGPAGAPAFQIRALSRLRECLTGK
jgi:Glycosyl hydrolase family 9